jgi:hypothetical protein
MRQFIGRRGLYLLEAQKISFKNAQNPASWAQAVLGGL